MSSIGYFFKESLQGFTRNLSTALGSIITIFLSLLIIGIFLVGGVMVERLMSSVEDEVSITAYVADDASQTSIDKVMSDLRGIEGVASVNFTTKDQALEKFRNSMTSNPEIIDQLDGTNPLPASIDVELTDPQLVESVAGQIESNTTYRQICEDPSNVSDSVKYGQNTVERLFTVTNYVRYIGVALIALLIFIAMVFINNTIRLAILARRKEIAIMRLVGASNGFIRGPSSWRAPCMRSSARFWRSASCSFCACSRCLSCKTPSSSSISTSVERRICLSALRWSSLVWSSDFSARRLRCVATSRCSSLVRPWTTNPNIARDGRCALRPRFEIVRASVARRVGWRSSSSSSSRSPQAFS